MCLLVKDLCIISGGRRWSDDPYTACSYTTAGRWVQLAHFGLRSKRFGVVLLREDFTIFHFSQLRHALLINSMWKQR